MKLKTFVAPTTGEAMNLVRREIGEDAIILATREHPNGGIAVTVAIDDGEFEPEELAATDVQSEAMFEFDAAERSPAEPNIPRRDNPPDRPTGPSHPFSITEPEGEGVAEILYETFRAHRLPAAIGGTLMDLATEFETSDPVSALAAALNGAFDFSPVEPSHLAGPIMAVGPPGAGKTQTLAKLAARSAMAGKQVTMITTDVERTGRSAPFAGFAATLGCVLVEAPDPQTLNRAVANAVASDLVVIDTPGANHLDPQEMSVLQECQIDGLVEPLLVVPAGLDPVEAADLAESFAAIGAQRAVVTRLDTTRRLAGLLAVGHERLLAFAQFGTGQRVKDGLCDADPIALAHALLPLRPIPDGRAGLSAGQYKRAAG